MDVKLELRCRVCLEYFASTSLHPLSDKDTRKMFQECTNLMVLAEDGCPQQLCSGCFERCLNSYKFRVQAIDSDKKLTLAILFQKESDGPVDADRCKAVPVEDEEEGETEQFVNSISGSINCDNKATAEVDPSPTDFEANTADVEISETNTETTRRNLLYYRCKKCYKLFSTLSSLRDHLRIHTGQKSLSCEDCRKVFSLNGTRVRHCTKEHIGEASYQCAVCEKWFITSASLKYHQILEQKCSVGANINPLRRHPLPCEICNTRFSSHPEFVMHMMSHRRQNSDQKDSAGRTNGVGATSAAVKRVLPKEAVSGVNKSSSRSLGEAKRILTVAIRNGIRASRSVVSNK